MCCATATHCAAVEMLVTTAAYSLGFTVHQIAGEQRLCLRNQASKQKEGRNESP